MDRVPDSTPEEIEAFFGMPADEVDKLVLAGMDEEFNRIPPDITSQIMCIQPTKAGEKKEPYQNSQREKPPETMREFYLSGMISDSEYRKFVREKEIEFFHKQHEDWSRKIGNPDPNAVCIGDYIFSVNNGEVTRISFWPKQWWRIKDIPFDPHGLMEAVKTLFRREKISSQEAWRVQSKLLELGSYAPGNCVHKCFSEGKWVNVSKHEAEELVYGNGTWVSSRISEVETTQKLYDGGLVPWEMYAKSIAGLNAMSADGATEGMEPAHRFRTTAREKEPDTRPEIKRPSFLVAAADVSIRCSAMSLSTFFIAAISACFPFIIWASVVPSQGHGYILRAVLTSVGVLVSMFLMALDFGLFRACYGDVKEKIERYGEKFRAYRESLEQEET